MAPFEQQRPCLHVALLPDAAEATFRWVQIGAEEEGVPCRLVQEQATDLVALAYATAQSSRFNIGIGVSDTAVVLHETHMPANKPVLAFEFAEDAYDCCRLMGSNAARMVIRKPFRFADELSPFSGDDDRPAEPEPKTASLPAAARPDAVDNAIDPAQVAQIVTLIVQKLQERGVR